LGITGGPRAEPGNARSRCCAICRFRAGNDIARAAQITGSKSPGSALEFTVESQQGRRMIATNCRHIVQRSGIRSGHAIVEGNRIGVHDVVALIQTGASVDEVVASLPRLTRAQAYECLAYFEDHRDEIEPLVAAQTAQVNG